MTQIGAMRREHKWLISRIAFKLSTEKSIGQPGAR